MSGFAGGVIRVLFVDDDPELAETAAEYLEEEHDELSVVTAGSAREGIRKLDGSIDCVVSDYDMPGRDGLQFLRAIRDDHPDLPFILLTGEGGEEVAAEAITAGVTDYVLKRGREEFEVLANRVVTAVGKRRAEQEARETNRRLRNLFERITDAFVSLDEDWRVTHLNSAAEELFGRDAAELEGEVFWVAFPDAIGTKFQKRLERAAERGEAETFEEFYPPLFTWLHVRVYPSEDGISLYIRRVEDVMPTDEDPRTIERQFRAVFERTSDPMLFVDDGGVCVEANPAAEDLLEIPAEELVDGPIATYVRDEEGFGVSWTGIAVDDDRKGTVTFTPPEAPPRTVRFEVAATFPGRFLVVLSPLEPDADDVGVGAEAGADAEAPAGEGAELADE